LLNSVLKRQEQARIDRENSRLLGNIIGDTGRLREFSPSALAAHYEQHQALLRRLSRYPPPR